MEIVLITHIGIYGLFILTLYVGWLKLPRVKNQVNIDETITFSIIIPIRNEAKNLPKLLAQLENQHFQKQQFELILVNDHSNDESVDLIEAFQAKSTMCIQLFHTEKERQSPKKQALQLGISKASGNYIITTDGDCRFGSDWLASLVSSIQNHPKMICGPVCFTSNDSLFENCLQIEFASLIGSSAALIALGRPTMCNGANLLFEKQAFYEVGGYEDNLSIASGDDEFLLAKFQRNFPGQIHFLKDARAIVKTAPPKTIKSLIQQRLRWASKWRHHRMNRIMAIGIFLWHAGMIACYALPFLSIISFQLLGIILICKLFLEGLFLGSVLLFLGAPLRPFSFLFTSFIHSFYVVFIGIRSLWPRFKWKGRSY